MPLSFPHRRLFFPIISGVLILGAALYGYNIHLAKQEAIRLEKEKIRLEEAQKDAEFQAIIDRFLSEFTIEIGTDMRNYKKNRRVVRELIQPINHETPEISYESYRHFTRVLMPYLRKQSAKVIDIFQRYKVALDKELIDESTARRDKFQKQWHDMMAVQLEKYIGYFIKEDKLLAGYQALIEFYYVHSKLVVIDYEENAFRFVRTQDEIKHLEILTRLKNIQ